MGITGTNNNSAKVYQCLTLSSVPENLRKKFFKCDKDGSGVLESSNMNGKNEIELMSKYWQDVSQNTIYGRVENKRTYSPEKPMRNNVYAFSTIGTKGHAFQNLILINNDGSYWNCPIKLDDISDFKEGYKIQKELDMFTYNESKVNKVNINITYN